MFSRGNKFNPMKKTITLLSLLWTCSVDAQLVSETVDFDSYVSASDNDFTNRFSNGVGLVQITTSGITGGCLETPATIFWGNDNAIYCSYFQGVIGVTYITGICFRYDTLQINTINFDRAASVWMKPYSDPNHYLVASVLHDRKLQIISYSTASTSLAMPLLHGHWYNLLLTADFDGGATGDEIAVNAQVNDLGLFGTDPPLPTGFANAMLYDSVLIADTSIEVSITGTAWGGARFLDNFRFDGMKSYDNCIATTLEDQAADFFEMHITDNLLKLNLGTTQKASVELISVSGQTVLSAEVRRDHSEIDVSTLPPGMYFVVVRTNNWQDARKVIRM